MIGLALVIGAGLGFSLMRRARSAPQPDRSAAAPQVDRSACRTCGYRLPAEASFCPQCGRPVINPPVCARCHTPLRPEARFCGHCGAPAGAPAGA
jgi:RNA polymerase subunit RPABC4/transcription elongation factor Spt4